MFLENINGPEDIKKLKNLKNLLHKLTFYVNIVTLYFKQNSINSN